MNQNINVSFDQSLPVVCEECGGVYFQEVLYIRKVSGILTGSSKPSYIPIPVFQCTECHHVNTEFLPREVQKLEGD